MPKKKIRFHQAIPILPVKNLKASLKYYIKKLGFKLDWESPRIMASVSRGDCSLMICEGDQGNVPTWVWIGVGSVATLYKELVRKKAKIRNRPANFPWAYEMQVEDPDGNVLRFGSDPLKGKPFGPWRDMDGQVWAKQRDGGWKKVG